MEESSEDSPIWLPQKSSAEDRVENMERPTRRPLILEAAIFPNLLSIGSFKKSPWDFDFIKWLRHRQF